MAEEKYTDLTKQSEQNSQDLYDDYGQPINSAPQSYMSPEYTTKAEVDARNPYGFQTPTGQNMVYSDESMTDQQDVTTAKVLSIVSLSLGILSIPLACCIGFGIIPAIGGIVCAAIALGKNRSGLAIAGLVTSIIGTVASLPLLILMIIGMLVP